MGSRSLRRSPVASARRPLSIELHVTQGAGAICTPVRAALFDRARFSLSFVFADYTDIRSFNDIGTETTDLSPLYKR